MNSVSKWRVTLGILLLGVVGCEGPPSNDNPFWVRSVVPPPPTGSYAAPGDAATPYYTPNTPATPSPGPGASSRVSAPAGLILPTSGIIESTSNVRTVPANIPNGVEENSVLISATVPVANGAGADAPLRIVENSTTTTAAVVARPTATIQSFGPAEPARFRPARTIVSTDAKVASPPSLPQISAPTVNAPSISAESLPRSGSLNWKPYRKAR